MTTPTNKLFGAILSAALIVGAVAGGPVIAQAHGGGPGLTYDPCMRQTGVRDFIHLAAYQPEFNPFAEYCDVLPKAGTTLLVVDLMGTGLPNTPISLLISGQAGHFRLSVPARRYRSGVADLRTYLPAGRYTVLVRVEEVGEDHHAVFALTVGAWWDGLFAPIAAILLIGVAALWYCLFQIRVIGSELRNPGSENWVHANFNEPAGPIAWLAKRDNSTRTAD
jgi:hypothetical protein